MEDLGNIQIITGTITDALGHRTIFFQLLKLKDYKVKYSHGVGSRQISALYNSISKARPNNRESVSW